MSTIKEIPSDLRPYEKVLKNGAGSLDHSELLAVILRCGTRGRSSVEVARSILQAGDGTLSGIRKLSYRDLLKIPGVGRVKAIQVLCLCALFVRFSADFYQRDAVFESPSWSAQRYMEELRFEKQELVKVVFLSPGGAFLEEKDMTKGTATASLFPVREILVEALRLDAGAVLVLHNHPGGDPSPSPEDIKATERLLKAARLSGIRLLDHLIIGDRKYASLREMGYI